VKVLGRLRFADFAMADDWQSLDVMTLHQAYDLVEQSVFPDRVLH